MYPSLIYTCRLLRRLRLLYVDRSLLSSQAHFFRSFARVSLTFLLSAVSDRTTSAFFKIAFTVQILYSIPNTQFALRVHLG